MTLRSLPHIVSLFGFFAATLSALAQTTDNTPFANNVRDFNSDTNEIAPGRWTCAWFGRGSFSNPGKPLQLFTGGYPLTSAASKPNWAADPRKRERAWFITADGTVYTDRADIAWLYTVPPSLDGKIITINGTATSTQATKNLRIHIAENEHLPAQKRADLKPLLDETGTTINITLTLPVRTGNILYFVQNDTGNPPLYWHGQKLNVSITQTQTHSAAPQKMQSTPTPRMAGTPPTSAIRTFAGTCHGIQNIPSLKEFVSWERDDIFWHKLEPQPGQWNQAELEKWGQRVLDLRAQGVTLLPILCYSSYDAIDTQPRTLYLPDGTRVDLTPDPDAPAPGAMIHTTFTRQLNPNGTPAGEWRQTEQKSVKLHHNSQISAAHIPAWENYVRRVVQYLSSPPYNLRHFQIWNEAHVESGFWRLSDTLDTYMQRVHLPASKVIRETVGPEAKIIYGGWPCCGSVQDYVALLDRHKAWGSIDIHDLHYFPLSSFEYIRRAAEKRALPPPSIWQTEIGFTKRPTTLANEYPRYLNWALRHGWDVSADPDKYKLFWFPAWSPDDPKAYGYRHALMLGDKLSPHGLSLKTLVELLSPGQFASYTEPVETRPILRAEMDERQSSLEAFTTSGLDPATRTPVSKIVLAIHLSANNTATILTDWNGDLGSHHLDHGAPTLTVSLPQLSPGRIASIRRVDASGISQPLFVQDAPNSTTLAVPIRDAKDSPASKWIDEGGLRTFYVEITLKP